jgi:DNA polymerase
MNVDFETYSSAGYDFNGTRWVSVSKSPPHGLGAVGSLKYAMHESTEVLCMAYGMGENDVKVWIPGEEKPNALFKYIRTGNPVYSWNCTFEYYIWLFVCHNRMGWPSIPFEQFQDPMETSKAFGYPPSLKAASRMGETKNKKKCYSLDKFCKPRNPTKLDPRTRLLPTDSDCVESSKELYEYNRMDVLAQIDLIKKIPRLSVFEKRVLETSQKINLRGVHVDAKGLKTCLTAVEKTIGKVTQEIQDLTSGYVTNANELLKIKKWALTQGAELIDLKSNTVDELIKQTTLPEKVLCVLKLRKKLSSSSVKKLYAIQKKMASDGRIRDLFSYCGAQRTGRFSGRGAQPQNLPNSGPEVMECENNHFFSTNLTHCPNCNGRGVPVKWCPAAAEFALAGNLENISYDVLKTTAGCLRSLFCAAPGKTLICSDFSAIEAVILAVLARESWRIEVFKTHGFIYETSASKITGIPLKEFIDYRKKNGSHHPLRNSIGKVAELASGYQGGLHAWEAFGAKDHLTETEIQSAIIKWRSESPSIIRFWKGLQKAAIEAVLAPLRTQVYHGIKYQSFGHVLACKLPSKRVLYYHAPKIEEGHLTYLTYRGSSFFRVPTYGGKLCENVVQAVARDILVNSLLNLEDSGYPVVLHVHDEIVSEVDEGVGSVSDFEKIMSKLPLWCKECPIKVSGGWCGKRYRK